MSRFGQSSSIVQNSFLVFRRHPVFLMPLLAVWCVYAPMVLYLRYRVDWDALSVGQALALNFGAIFVFAFLLTVSSSVLLELIEHLETREKPSLPKAIAHTLGANLLHMLPIILVWTVIWFVLAVMQALLTRKKNRGGARPKFSAEDAAKTLLGSGRFSFSAAFFRALQKAVRMLIFLILPSIAWERMGFFRGLKRGVAVFRQHLSRFAEAFAVTEVASILLFLPAIVVVMISKSVDIPSGVWVGVIIYTGFAWSYSVYLEQMYIAELYLWNLKWEKDCEARRLRGEPARSLTDVPPPRLLDNVYELLEPGVRRPVPA